MNKKIIIVLVALFLTWVLITPSIANAQITSSYDNNTHINPTAFTLTIYSPSTQNQTYIRIMPLNFTVDWTTYPTFTFPIPPAPKLNGVYTYAIDNNPAVTVTSNQSSSDIFGYSNFTVNPAFSYLVNVSNLTNGYHKIVITTSLYFLDEGLVFGASSSPVQFFVQNPTPTPTPTPAISALFSPLTITIIVTVVVLVAVIVSLLFYRRHRKISDLST
jgi:hypothetical protein